MALTYSQPMPLGTRAPHFSLPDTVSGNRVTLEDLPAATGTVIVFTCNHCPYVQHIEQALIQVAKQYQSKGIQFIAISANDVNDYPEDAPEQMQARARTLGYPFPYLYDESQAVAKQYGAQCTPEFYVFDQNLSCVYHGRFDDSSPGKDILPSGQDLCAALDALLAGQAPVSPQHSSMGCNIKWKRE